MDIPHELVKTIIQGDAVLFVGRQLSVEARLPGWYELIAPLADSIALPATLRTNPLKVAQYYQAKCGRQALIDYILEHTDSTGKESTDNHKRLTRLGISTWITTNCDTLLEHTLREVNKRFTRVVRDQDLPYTSIDRTTLIKLHGDREQPDTIVITQQDYETYFRRFPAVKQKLGGLLVDKSFFFVGYNINDPDFNQLLAAIAFDLHQHQRPAYVVLFDVDEFTLADMRERNIHVLNIPTTEKTTCVALLGTFLDELIEAIGAVKKISAQTTVSAKPLQLETANVNALLEAMDYRSLDVQLAENKLYFLCNTKWGAEIQQELVSFVEEEPGVNDLMALQRAVKSYKARRGILLTREPLSIELQDLAQHIEEVCLYTLDEFTDCLADFRPYLHRLIENYEASEIPQSYVPLAIKSTGEEAPHIFKPLESFIDSWLKEQGCNHISLLGDFGSGKTWFCQHYAYLSAKRYLSAPTENRIPILITLRHYSRAYSLEQLITDAIINRFDIRLPAGYKTFAQLNKAGRLLLIFDGFDEMERRVGDYRTAADNFWEMDKVVQANSRVLLTCRTAYFRHYTEEKATLLPMPNRRITTPLSNGEIDLQATKKFELVYLLDFTDEDICAVLQKRLSADWENIYKQIQDLSNLRDLASRPVLLDMLVKTLPQIHVAPKMNQATLYEIYINRLLQQRWSEDTDYILPRDRLFFVQELAWEMHQIQRLSIPFSEFPERVVRHFDLKDNPGLAAFFERDVRTQSYLVRDDIGNYRFSHRSFMEYFVARKMASAITNTHINMDQIIETWKSKPLTTEICDFLVHMLDDPEPLWRLILATSNRSLEDTGYAGGNAATLLRLQGISFVRKNLSHTILAGADLRNSDLTDTDLRGAYLRQANMRNCLLLRTDVRGADLTNISIGEMGAIEAVMFDPTGEVIASGSADGAIRLWDWVTGKIVGQFLSSAGITTICFSTDGQLILAGVGQHGHIKMWERKSGRSLGTFIGHTGPVWEISLCPGSPQFVSGAHDGSIRIWDINSCTQIKVIHKQDRGIWDVCYSPDGAYIAAAGGPNLGIYDAQTGKLVWTAPEQTAEFRSVKYSKENWLAYTTREGSIVVRNASTKELIRCIQGSFLGANSMAFSPDGTMLAVGSNGPEIKIQVWDITTGIMVIEGVTNSSGYVGRIHWGAQHYLVSGSSDGIIRIWDSANPESGQCFKSLEARMNCRRMRIDGARGLDALAPDRKGTLRSWFISRGAVEWPPHSTK